MQCPKCWVECHSEEQLKIHCKKIHKMTLEDVINEHIGKRMMFAIINASFDEIDRIKKKRRC